ncbi:MAG: hypothetical protein Q4E34_05235 [Synergistaceae bacterium]|nr:hypothetical protein [Synergistaceae bacterium]
MKIRKTLKYIALPMAVLMLFSSAAFASPHCGHRHYHHRHDSSGGWGIAAAGVVGGLILGALINSSRNERRQDPGEYRQDPGEYRQDPGVSPLVQPSAVVPDREVELAEKVPGGVMINGRFYAPAERETAADYTAQPYYAGTVFETGRGAGLGGSYPEIRRDPGRNGSSN